MSRAHDDITIGLIVEKVKSHWRQLLVFMAAVAMIMIALMLSIPDYYRSNQIVGYEEKTSTVLQGLHTIGGVQGYNLGKMTSNPDAIFPVHFVILLKSDAFMTEIMQIPVTLQTGERMSYYDYLCAHPQQTWWNTAISTIESFFQGEDTIRFFNPQKLTPKQARIISQATKRVFCMANTEKNTVTFSVIDRDAFVCAQMADSICQHVNAFMVRYREGKIKERLAVLEEQTSRVTSDYEQALQTYAQYANAHSGLTLGSYRIRHAQLRRLMEEKELVWKAVRAQRDLEREKLDDKTAMFVTIQKAGVSIRPEGPRRLFNISIAVLLTFLMGTLYLLRNEFRHQLF